MPSPINPETNTMHSTILLMIITRAITAYSLSFKSATRRGYSFNAARDHGKRIERAYIANEIKRYVDRSLDCHVIEWGGSVENFHSLEFSAI